MFRFLLSCRTSDLVLGASPLVMTDVRCGCGQLNQLRDTEERTARLHKLYSELADLERGS
eukprot:1194471-Prorocentrum_minimum.AAC.7